MYRPGRRATRSPICGLRLTCLADEFVQEPAQIRNKIAHGQWAVALNRTRTAVNPDISAQIQNLDVVTLDKWFEVAKVLAAIIEDMIESPERHFRGSYWVQLSRLEEQVNRMANWTRDSRVAELRRKPIPHPELI
jgi:hypothetical protein